MGGALPGGASQAISLVAHSLKRERMGFSLFMEKWSLPGQSHIVIEGYYGQGACIPSKLDILRDRKGILTPSDRDRPGDILPGIAGKD